MAGSSPAITEGQKLVVLASFEDCAGESGTYIPASPHQRRQRRKWLWAARTVSRTVASWAP